MAGMTPTGDAAGALPLLRVLRDTAVPELPPAQWRSLLTQARRCKLSGRLAVLAHERGWMPMLPEGVQRYLGNVQKAWQRKRLDTLWEADRLLQAMQALDMPIVLLKGAAYVLADLPAARGREFSDVDVLVPRERLRDAERQLLAHGWVAATIDPYDDRYYRDWMHELPPMQHVQRLTYLDVHHTLTPPTSRFAIDMAALWPACRPIGGHPGLSVLAPADLVLHSAVHLMQEGDFGGGLRDLVDLCDLIGAQGADEGFWAALVERARRLGLAVPLHDAVALAHDLLGLPVPTGAGAQLAAAAGPRWRRQLVLGCLRRAVLAPLAPRPRRGDAIAARLLYMRSHWLRMPWYLLAPHLLRKAWRRARFKAASPQAAGPVVLR